MNGAGFVFYETEEPKHAMKYFTWKFIVIFFKIRGDFSEYMVCYTAGNGIKQVTFSFVSKQKACLNNYEI